MQLNLLLLLVSSILLLSACGESEEAVLSPAANSMTNAIPFPPVAKKIPYELEAHGDVRIDDYYWLRDDERVNPEMLAHLEAENQYKTELLAHTEQFQEQLFDELVDA